MADLAHATENDTDLHGDTDARHWAERLRHHYERNGLNATTLDEFEEVMVVWFAGAIETGKMAGFAQASRPEHGAALWAEPYGNSSWYAECYCGGHFINLNREGADAALQLHIAHEQPDGATLHYVRSWACLRPDLRDWSAQCRCSVSRIGDTMETVNAALRAHFEEVNAG